MFELIQVNPALLVMFLFVLAGGGGLVAVRLIRWHHERDPFVTLFGVPAEVAGGPAHSDQPLNIPAAAAQVEYFDPRPYRFQLRWDPELGTYASRARNREENKIFRQRVYSEFRLYVEYGLDTLALCDVVRKSVAFTESERTEIIADLAKN